MPDVLVGLADAIEALRQELAAAISFGDGQEVKFSLQPLELTLEVAIASGANGEIGWHILKFGAKRDFERTQTLTLRLTPFVKRSDGTYTDEFTITGASPEGQRFANPTPRADAESELG